MAAATIVRFQPNIPETLQLKEAQGRPVNGRYGHQYHHVLADGRVVYVHPVVEQRITDLAIRDGEAVEITKKVEGDVTRWAVRRADTAPSNSAPEHVPVQIASSAPAAEQANGTGRAGASKLASAALIAAIDSLMDAREYATSKGLDVEVRLDFNAEDVRALAATMLIQHYRRAENDERYRRNGSATWEG